VTQAEYRDRLLRQDCRPNSTKTRRPIVYDGSKGWRKMGEDTSEMTPKQLTEQKEGMHAGYVATLLPEPSTHRLTRHPCSPASAARPRRRAGN